MPPRSSSHSARSYPARDFLGSPHEVPHRPPARPPAQAAPEASLQSAAKCCGASTLRAASRSNCGVRGCLPERGGRRQ